MPRRILSVLTAGCLLGAVSAFGSVPGTAVVTHAPTVDGTIDGSVQQMSADSASLNGTITGSWFVPGTPAIRTNGHPSLGGISSGVGSETPANYTITVSGSASVGHVVTRSDPHPLPLVAAPAAAAGTRDVVLDTGTDAGDFSTVRNLTAHGAAGVVAVPPGTYGDFTADAGATFELGVAGSTVPAIYNFQQLTLNGTAAVEVVGPVIVTVANGFTAGGRVGTSTNPAWLQLDVAQGGLTLNGGSTVYGYVQAPAGEVIVDGNSTLVGGCAADRLTINGAGLVRLIDFPPAVTQTAPADGTIVAAPGTLNLQATASDLDGWVQKVEFFAGAAKVGEADAAPYTFTWANVPYGTYTLTTVATDNAGGTTTSAPVTVIVDQPPTVSIAAPAADAVITAPGDIVVQANAADIDGTVAKVEFFANGTKIGESTAAPFSYEWKDVPYGHYTLTAVATDNLGISTTSAPVPIIVNQPPTVSLTAPAAGALFVAPASVTLSANAADVDGTVAKVAFFNGATELGEVAGGSDAVAPFALRLTLPPGMYTLTAVASDNLGASTATAPVRFVVDAPPTVAVTAPAAGAVLAAGGPITLSANASDSDGTVAKVQFYAGATLVGTATVAPYSVTWTNVAAGSYTITATATDNLGIASTSSPVAITVDVPPAVALTAPANNTTVAAANSLTLTASASDADGTIAKVDFYEATTLLGTATAPAPAQSNSFILTLASGLPAGNYTLAAVATDNVGLTAASVPVTIRVNTIPKISVNAGPNQTATIRYLGSIATAAPFAVQTLTTTPFNSPIAVTYNPHLNKVVVSTNYWSGMPYNFEYLNPDGTHVQFSSISGLGDEVMIDCAPDDNAGMSFGGFPAGTMFCGSGVGGVIAKISPDGSMIENPWVKLPNETGLLRGAVYVDRSGSWDGDLIVSTTSGGIWRVNAAGKPTKVAQLPASDWEALVTLPNNPTRWGPWAGKILVGDEFDSNVYTIDTKGVVTPYKLNIPAVEFFNLVPPGQNFYGVDNINGRVLGVASAAFTNMIGDLLVTSEYSDTWTSIHWNGSKFVTKTLYTTGGSFEGAGFAPVGVAQLPSPPAGATVALSGVVLENGAAAPATATLSWAELSGPGAVQFSSPHTAQTSASFANPGTYVLQLSAQDGALSAVDTVTITISENQIPAVYAGGNQAVSGPGTPFVLSGAVIDDGLPNPPGALTTQWTKLSGPGNVTFTTPAAVITSAVFDTPGTYVLKLTAADGLDTGADTMEARVGVACVEPPANIAAWWPGNDRPTELIHGGHDVTFSGTAPGASNYGVGQVGDGFWFDGIGSYATVSGHSELDVGKSVAGFTIAMWVRDDLVGSGDSTFFEWRDLTNGGWGVQFSADIHGQNAHLTFRTTSGDSYDVSGQNVFTGQQGKWVHVAFTYDRANGDARVFRNGVIVAEDYLPANLTAQTSYDILFGGRPDQGAFKGMLDEVALFNRPLAAAEIASIYNAGGSGMAPLGDNTPPSVSAGPNGFVPAAGGTVKLAGTVTDDGRPFGAPTIQWGVVSAPAGATVTFGSPAAAQTTATFSAAGTYLLRLTASDGYAAPVSSLTEVRVGSAAAQPAAGLAGWWPGNGTPQELIHGHAVELFNDAAYASGEVLQGFTFDGTDDFGVVPANSDDDVGQSSSGFTVEFWVRNDRVAGGDGTFFEWRSRRTGAYGVEFMADNNGQNAHAVFRTKSGASYDVSAQDFFTSAQGTWLHFAFTYDARTGLARIYRNGLVTAWTYLPAGLVAQTGYDLCFGGAPGQSLFQGMLDEVAIYARPLQYNEVAAIYAAGADGKSPLLSHAAPTVSAGRDVFVSAAGGSALLTGSATDDGVPLGNPVLTWRVISAPAGGQVTFANPAAAQTTATFSTAGTYLLELSAADGVTAPVTSITEARVATSTVQPPAGLADWWPGNGTPHEVVHGQHDVMLMNGSTYGAAEVGQGFTFDGVDDYGIVTASADTNIGQSAAGFSVECWVRDDRVQNGDSTLLQWRDLRTNAFGLELRADNNGQNVHVNFRTTSGGFVEVSAANFFTGLQGQWVHLGFTYDAVSGNARIYENGRLAAETYFPKALVAQTSYDVLFGGYPGQGAFKGMLDEVTFYNRPLTDTEMVSLSAAGVNGKDPLLTHTPPSVLAGPNAFAPAPGVATALAGAVYSDNQPSGAPATAWSVVAGPDGATTTFANPNSPQTTVTTSVVGTYLLALTASDGVTAPVVSYTELRVGTSAAAAPAGLAAWWPANASARELVHGNHDVQLYNGATYATARVLDGFYFDGSDDYATAPAHPDLDIGQSAAGFSVEFWIRNDRVQSGDCTLLEWRNLQTNSYGLELRADNNGQNVHVNFRTTSGGFVEMSAANFFTGLQGQWLHLALTYDRSTGRARLFRNAVLVAETFFPSGLAAQTGYDLFFGGRPDQGTFKGILDEVSLYTRPLRATEIAAIAGAGPDGKSPLLTHAVPLVSAGPNVVLAGTADPAPLAGAVADDNRPSGPPSLTWSVASAPSGATVAFANPAVPSTTATFSAPGTYLLQLTATDGLTAPVSAFTEVRVAAASVPPPPGLVAWWPGNGSPREIINGGHDVEAMNGATYAAGQVLLGFLFDGVDDYGVVRAHPDIDLGQSAAGFSIEFWIRNDRVQNGESTLLEWRSLQTNSYGLELRADNNGQNADFIFRATSGASANVAAANIFNGQQGQWMHLAFTYDRSTGAMAIYRNGVSVAHATTSVGLAAQTGFDLFFGGRPDQGAFKGMLDEVSFYNRPLTATEVGNIYSAGVSGKTPPVVNQAPVVAIGATPGAFVGAPIQLTGTASDDGLPNPPASLTYAWSLVSGPAGGNVTFGSPTALTTSAAFPIAGTYIVQFSASDSALTGSATTTINVAVPPSSPSVTITTPVTAASYALGNEVDVVANATDPGASIAKVDFYSGTSLLGTATAPISGQPNAYALPTAFTPAAAGTYSLTAVATDSNGITATSAAVTVSVIADPGPPTVQLTAPADTGRLSAPTVVTGVVQSALLTGWKLEYRLQPAEGQAGDAWTALASGTTAVGKAATPTAAAVSDKLGAFDPTALVNGLYQLRLTATDTAGRTVIAGPLSLIVEGNMKLGVFSLAFEDLKVPLAGIPLTVTRTYDTRDLRVGDFGPGWRLAIADLRVQKNRPLGTGWYQTLQSGNSLQFYYVDPVGDRIVTVTMPDGETDRFKLGAVVKNRVDDPDDASFGIVVAKGTLKFYPIGDTTATLEPLDASNQLNNQFYIWGTGDQDLMTGDMTDPAAVPYNATRFRLTTKDGTVYILDEALGLLSMRDANGNTLVVNRDAASRVSSLVSTQNLQPTPLTVSVTIHRDTTGRVDYIRDPAGHDLDYLYDAQGRLSSFTDRELNVTQFRYENASFPNYLTKVIDPRGVSAIRSEYDSAGKMIKQIDADGHETDFNHGVDTTGQFQKVTDRLGNSTTYYYDERGNITLKIDPLGAQTTYAYYPDSDRVEFETDAYGNVKSTAYDARGNPTVQTVGANASEDPATPTTGHTTRTTYNAFSVPTAITDPDGRAQAFTYDATTNNLLAHTVGAGGTAPATTTYAYNTDGTVKSVTDALGDVTAYQYIYGFSDPAYPGAVKQVTITVTDPAGATGSDATNAADTVLRSARMLYDAQENQLAQIVTRHLPDGTAQDVVTQYVYDTENRLTATLLPDGRVNETRYNAIGKPDRTLEWTSVAAYQAKDDSKARVTTYGYDDRGNQVSVSYPDGTNQQAAFDAENRKVWSQDQRGYRTFYTYDADGRLLSTIYPDANDGIGTAAPSDPTDARLADNPRTRTVYDLDGRVTDTYDELGHHTQTVYYADGTADAGRREQTVQYVTVAGKQATLTTAYQYDGAGNVRYVTDPRGNTVETRYDDQGRPTVVAYPATDENAATTVQTTYDALGRRIATTDQEGKLTRYRYDGLGRLAEVRQYLDQSLAASDGDYHLTPTTTGIVSTRYTYDELGNEQTQTDALGRVTTFWTDALGRRTKRVLPKDATDSAVLAETLQYDAWGNLWKRTDFAGMTTTYGYDVMNRLTSKTADPSHPSLTYSHAIAKVGYGYNAAGERTSATTYNTAGTVLYTESTPRDERGRIEYKDTAAGRLDYSYYANNLLKDTVSSNAGGVNAGYRYDEADRLAHVDDDSTGTTLTTDYGYDANGNLASLAQPNGVTHSYGYDTLNRLRTLTVSQLAAGATQPGTLHAYEYKLYPSGHRHEVLEGAKTTTYGYDALYRLTQEAITGDAHGNNGTVGYELDKVGNRLSRTSPLAALPSQANLTYNARDWLSGDTYDANGSTLTSSQLSTLNSQLSGTDSYDFENRLIVRTRADGSTINLSYDADGNRIAKNILDASGSAVSSTGYLVDANNPTGYAQVVEETVNGVLTRVYTYGTGLISESVVSGASSSLATHYYAFDGHGNVRELTDSTGSVTDRYDYDAFGTLIYQSGSTTNTHLYCGESYDADLGLYYLRARYLNPNSGRFWSMDSYEGEAGDPASLHHYNYAGGEPVTSLDPSGNFSLVEMAATTAVVSTVAMIAQPAIRPMVAGVVGYLAGNPDARYSLSSIGVYSESAQLLEALGISPADFSHNLFADAFTDIGTNALTSVVAGAAAGYVSNAFAAFRRSAPVYLPREGTTAAETLAGSGPASGVLEVSSLRPSVGAMRNYNPAKAIEYVFDPASERFVVGAPQHRLPMYSPHENLAKLIGANPSEAVGGMFGRGPNGEFIFNEFSGHFWQNWNPTNRIQFINFMEARLGGPIVFKTGM